MVENDHLYVMKSNLQLQLSIVMLQSAKSISKYLIDFARRLVDISGNESFLKDENPFILFAEAGEPPAELPNIYWS